MAYCTQDDIIREFKAIVIDSTTAITPDDIDAWIADESIYIDAKVGLRFNTPIDKASAPNAYAILKRICVFRVSERVRDKLEVKGPSTNKSSDEKSDKKINVKTPNDDLNDIVKGLLLLDGAVLKSSETGVSSFNVSTGVPKVFDTTKQQW